MDKYKRDRRRIHFKCTECGGELTDTAYMKCKRCRDKNAEYVRQKRKAVQSTACR